MAEQPPSPLKNVVGGGGCGCGCLGGTVLLAGLAVLAGIPLGFYATSGTAQAGTMGVLAIGGGLLLGVLGAGVWLGSKFLN